MPRTGAPHIPESLGPGSRGQLPARIGVTGRRPGPRPTAGRAERGGRLPRPPAVRLWRWRR